MRSPSTTEVSSATAAVARVGLAARGITYVLISVLAVALALGKHGTHADQKGVITTLAGRPFGSVLVVALALGLTAYAAWQLVQVVTGVVGEPDSTAKRLRSAASAIAYGALAVGCVSVLRGARRSQSSEQQGLTARVMHHSGGRLVVGAVGVVVIVVGVVFVAQAVTAGFMKRMEVGPGRERSVVTWLGRVGTASRGLVVALAGWLVLHAAVAYEPKQARGVNGAFRTLLHQPYGRWLTAAAALGLLTFGLFGLAEAKYRRVTPDRRRRVSP